MAAADGLLRAFERTDATLSLVEARLDKSLNAEYTTVNPQRLLRRLALLEAELPRLRAAAEKNASARRDILGTLTSQQVINQQGVLQLARRSHAQVNHDEAEWDIAHSDLEASFSSTADTSAGAGPTVADDYLTVEQWRALPSALRDGLTHGELNAFFGTLRGHFARRDVRELQAAQLVAFGMRIGDESHTRMLNLLERAGLLRCAGNAIYLA